MLSWTTDISGNPSPDSTRAPDISDAQMGVAQSEISRIEKRHDMLLSTLTSYLSAAGEHPTVVVTVNGQGRRTGLDDLGRRTLGLDTASKFAAGRVTTASISRPDVGRSRAVRVQQAGVKTDHSQPRQIGPRSVDGGSVSDSQAEMPVPFAPCPRRAQVAGNSRLIAANRGLRRCLRPARPSDLVRGIRHNNLVPKLTARLRFPRQRSRPSGFKPSPRMGHAVPPGTPGVTRAPAVRALRRAGTWTKTASPSWLRL